MKKGDFMHKLANISQFEALMNVANNIASSNAVFNDGGEWKSDGWHSYSEVPPVDPDDGWNYMRRTDPEEFIRCGLVSPDDGQNWLRLANPGRFEATEKAKKHNELAKKVLEDLSFERPDIMNELDADLEGLIAQGNTPYNIDEYERLRNQMGLESLLEYEEDIEDPNPLDELLVPDKKQREQALKDYQTLQR